jgi:hypothetical protein
MKSENRYLFQGHAVAASAQFRRFKDQPIKVDNCLKNVSAAIPADGGCLTASSERQEIRHEDRVLYAFDSAFAGVTGDYLDQHAAFLETNKEHRNQELGVFTACEALLKNLSVLDNRLFVETLQSQLTAEDTRDGRPVRFFAKKPPVIAGVRLENKPLVVEIDIDDVFLGLPTKHDVVREHEKNDAFRKECQRRHYAAHQNFIVTSIVKTIRFPDGEPDGVTVLGNHVLKVENFGYIFFGELLIGETTRRLTMLRLQLGSDTGGSSCSGESKPNGQTT